MTSKEQSAHASSRSFWSRIPDIWKAIGVVLAIGGTAIGGYATIDDVRDSLEQRISTMEQRISAIEGSMIIRDDLGSYVVSDTLRLESCIQGMRARMHEYRALERAYEELLLAMRLEEFVFINRPLTEPESEQRDRIVELRSSFEQRKFEITKDWKRLDNLITERKC